MQKIATNLDEAQDVGRGWPGAREDTQGDGSRVHAPLGGCVVMEKDGPGQGKRADPRFDS
jgi:hypothetical protein